MFNFILSFAYLATIIFIILCFILLLPPGSEKIKKLAKNENLATLSSILILSAYIFIIFGFGIKMCKNYE